MLDILIIVIIIFSVIIASHYPGSKGTSFPTENVTVFYTTLCELRALHLWGQEVALSPVRPSTIYNLLCRLNVGSGTLGRCFWSKIQAGSKCSQF